MNIDQYRAIKAKEKEEEAQVIEQPIQPDPEVDETKPDETTPPEETTPTHEEPQKFTIEGIGEVSLDELKNGYLRQSDYTKKTQDVSRKSKEAEEAMHYYNFIKQNPQIAEQLKQSVGLPQSLDPSQQKVQELETKLYDMMLEREIEALSGKYDDFEVREVLQEAHDKRITNLEDAYLLVKSRKASEQSASADPDKLKKQLREEILKELQEEKVSTRTTVGTGSTQTPEPSRISPAEQKVIDNMFDGNTKEYLKWKKG